MKIGVAKEYWPGEVRTALVPANAKKLIGLGFSIVMEKKAGSAAGFSDADYSEVGVELADARADVVGQ
ncbi:MAG TPA: NAD(P)(+) transhydrogenase (Re/Si-specific) subunit alpha, partial [Gammaproteobacteria bacterium]|nr:NAD(P)(+) transhydrogenase (Re/Si-specific) subunit alpha [Gammaproteobacteria bacterium]